MGFIIGLLLTGIVAGFLARLLVPGKDKMTIGWTIALGLAGSLVGGLIGRLIFDSSETTTGIIGSVVGAVIILIVYNKVTRRGRHR